MRVMLWRLRENLTLGFIALLPLHALAVTVVTKLVAGPGHAPLSSLALWKEWLLVVILIITIVEIFRSGKPWLSATKKFDAIDLLILALVVLAFASTPVHQYTSHQFLLGFKYDFIPLTAFLVLRRVGWSERFIRHLTSVICIVGAAIAVYGLLTFILPEAFFQFLGYSDLHSAYVPSGPISAFQNIGGTALRRMQSTFSGPNQLGLWMLIPWTMVLAAPLRGRGPHPGTGAARWFILFILSIAILFTFSRTAWIGAAVIFVISHFFMRKKDHQYTSILMRVFLMISFIGAVIVILRPGILVRPSSTLDHLRRPIEAMKIIAANPFGLGLGSAGPAQNRVADPCLDFPAGSDISWAKDRPGLCIFVDHVQKQPDPSVRSCRCPFLPENWYLQIGIELGVIGLVLYLTMVFVIARSLWDKEHFTFPIFVALSVAALFLHAFEDSAVVYTLWILLSASLPVVWEKRAA